MKCPVQNCLGEYQDELLTMVQHRNGQIIVIDNVPASVCDFCGYTTFSPQTVRQMQRIKQSSILEPVASAPVYDFAQGATTENSEELVSAAR